MTLRRLVRIVRNRELIDNLFALAAEQSRLYLRCIEDLEACAEQYELAKAETNRVQLTHFKEIRELVSKWRVSLEDPEMDVRDDLEALLAVMDARIALHEEHVV